MDRRNAARLAWVLVATLLSLITVFNQVKAMGLGWQEEHYFAALEDQAHGRAPIPQMQRMLSNLPLYTLCKIAAAIGVPRPVGVTFVAVRLLQNIGLFLLALVYWRRLGISPYLGMLGISALAWAMTHANYANFLQVDAYTELIFYVVGAYFLVAHGPEIIWAITFQGAINRETIFLLPLMTIAAGFLPSMPPEESKRFRKSGLISLVVFLVVYLVSRIALGGQFNLPSVEMFVRNATFDKSWQNWLAVWGIIPIIALAGYREWPPMLRAFFWSLVPAWFALHWFFTPVASAQFLLLPLILVLLPAALLTVQKSRDDLGQRP